VAHIVSKTVNGKKYLYLYESYREDGRVRKRYLRYLGPEDVLT